VAIGAHWHRQAVDVTISSGTVLAGFRVETLIGEGAMGAVYVAKARDGRRVALKVLAPELARDDRFRGRFLRESQVAGGLSHPNIVSVLEAGEEDGVLFLAMEYIQGSDLRELLRREGRLKPVRALELLGQVAEALDTAHAADLVHRDVKPANILVSGGPNGERACVCDFGLARRASSVGSLTGERGFVGTIDYVPPEQIEGAPVDGRTDVYSLGCVLFECLAGQRPFERESELAVVFAHLNEPPPRLSDVRPDLPNAFDDVFASALAKSPHARYSTCGELVEAARAALRGTRPARRRTRRTRLILAAGMLAAAGTAAGALLVSEDSGHAPAISQTAIDGAPLGLQPSAYERLFGLPTRRQNLTDTGHTKVTFARQKVAVYFFFKGLSESAVEITTWNKAFRTAEGIGPCSTIAEAKKVYGRRFRPNPWTMVGGNVFTYSVGKQLVFAAQGRAGPVPSKRVSAVGLYYGTEPGANRDARFASYVAINEQHCS
jgi:tRNA A-37 threonylcarbamoyl transferase component Bud32